ncbi:hypothetical protein [Winogradskyella sp. 3972H.M.0a.05]|uniref:hypothetical protein n=1 Tax=Winogradskyella sp. 3972H.M.0a.05 TaxID=2950277 RepID=UPI00339374E1
MYKLENILRSIIIQGLENKYANKKFRDIVKAAEEIDDYIIDQIESILYTYTANFIKNSSLKASYESQFISCKSRLFKLKVSEPVTSDSTILIGYLEVIKSDLAPARSINLQLDVDGIGRYNKIELILPKSLVIDIKLLEHAVKCIFESCYRWLLIKTRDILRSQYILSNEIYKPVKIAFSNFPDVMHSLWFVVKIKDDVIFLLDEDNVNYTLDLFNKNKEKMHKSPYLLLKDFIDMKLPFGKSFAAQAFKAKKPIHGKIDYGNYFDDMTELALSQIGVFTNEITVHPIFTDGRIHLYGSYPTKHNELIEPFLESNEEIIIQEFKILKSRIRRMFKNIRAQHFDLYTLAEIAGGFFGALIRALTKE